MKRYLLLLTLSLTAVFFVRAGELTLTGIYQGKDIYVRNPYDLDSRTFCTDEVYVNDALVLSDIRASAYTITLSHLPSESTVRIRILHKPHCRPEVLNAEAVVTELPFAFRTAAIQESVIRWSAEGETAQTAYVVEKDMKSGWVVMTPFILAKNTGDVNTYEVKAEHFSGMNRYRIKASNERGEVRYSEVMAYVSDASPVTFSPRRRVRDRITLSRSAPYKILDEFGELVREGEGATLELADLPPGDYYLHVDRLTEKFTKK